MSRSKDLNIQNHSFYSCFVWAVKAHNIKVNLKEGRWLGMDWADLAQERDKCQDVVNTVMNFQVP